jgi:hypothetical protein
MYTLAGFEPGSSVPWADAVTTVPRRQCVTLELYLREKLKERRAAFIAVSVQYQLGFNGPVGTFARVWPIGRIRTVDR